MVSNKCTKKIDEPLERAYDFRSNEVSYEFLTKFISIANACGVVPSNWPKKEKGEWLLRRIQNHLSESFTAERGLRQGDSLACLQQTKQLRSRLVSRRTKMRLYKTLLLPVLLYASETWTLNVDVQRALETFERKVLRTIFGPVQEQGCWRTRYNFELYRRYKEPQVAQIIQSYRLRWLGHIWRTPKITRLDYVCNIF
ncbi:hypothetical protein AVEN_1906-1 [Araneus ventricosus]|uniref:Reverse transcriptase domain-containing protein n=1 Tax=Araneus ventricosus TaxID=182803 RepID=A0A4Y2J258_ARAVE|nr:hypothetical protein AVEN_1906-1 [Araneus ventricosus]